MLGVHLTESEGGWDKTIRLWDTATGQETVVLRSHADAVNSLAFSPDGTRLASASDDRTIVVWVADRDPHPAAPRTRSLRGHAGPVLAVTYSPGGERVASAGDDRTARIWDAEHGSEVMVLTGHKALVAGVAWSSTESLLATASADKTVRLWDSGTGRPVRILHGHTDRIYGIAFSPDGRLLATGGWDPRFWDFPVVLLGDLNINGFPTPAGTPDWEYQDIFLSGRLHMGEGDKDLAERCLHRDQSGPFIRPAIDAIGRGEDDEIHIRGATEGNVANRQERQATDQSQSAILLQIESASSNAGLHGQFANLMREPLPQPIHEDATGDFVEYLVESDDVRLIQVRHGEDGGSDRIGAADRFTTTTGVISGGTTARRSASEQDVSPSKRGRTQLLRSGDSGIVFFPPAPRLGFLPMRQSCRGPSRREMLRAGCLAPLGAGLASLLAAEPSGSAAKAKSVILLYMWGGPSQIETWDPKPNAPLEVRGLFKPIATTVPGLQIGEHFPELAKRAKHYAVIRSMTHTDPAHLSPTHHLLTGRKAAKLNSDADGPSRSDAPCIGAVVQKTFRAGALPNAVTLPWAVSHPSAPGGQAPGQNGGWLGSGYDPFLITGNPNSPKFAVSGLAPAPDVPTQRLQSRAELCRVLDRTGGGNDANAGLRQKALDLLMAPAVAKAFDLNAESPKMRDAYGRHAHGQSCLLARRLIEAGTKFVTVNWPDDGQTFWDTHGNNFPSLKDRLMPPADRAFSALLDDLSTRGLLGETLVVWIGEFGRSPRVNGSAAGRDHWPKCYSAVLAGAGIRGGSLYGASDKIAGAPAENPVSPADLTATMYHALGIDPQGPVADRLGREIALTEGTPLVRMFG